LLLQFAAEEIVRGHPFMTSTRKSRFFSSPQYGVHILWTWNTYHALETASTRPTTEIWP